MGLDCPARTAALRPSALSRYIARSAAAIASASDPPAACAHPTETRPKAPATRSASPTASSRRGAGRRTRPRPPGRSAPRPGRRAQGASKGREQSVPRRVALAVVHALEVVHVPGREGRPAGTVSRQAPPTPVGGLERPPVAAAGERVGEGHRLQGALGGVELREQPVGVQAEDRPERRRSRGPRAGRRTGGRPRPGARPTAAPRNSK
jgi:hypothetical protein